MYFVTSFQCQLSETINTPDTFEDVITRVCVH